MTGLPEELCQHGEEFFNYCLWPYLPVAETENKLTAANVLYQSFAQAAVGFAGRQMVDALRSAIGRNKSVWGIKWSDGELGWEFYFYDYRRRQRERSLTRVLHALAPQVHCTLPRPEALPYFMFSLDLGPALRGTSALEHVNLYLGNVGSSVSSGVSYKLTAEGRSLENFYFFFEAEKHLELILGKLGCSAFITVPEVDYAEIVWPELVECQTICLANKRTHDCIYFSGVKVEQLLYFMRRLCYPPGLIAYVERERSRLDHLLFDVGYDFTYDADGLHLVKSGFYGVV